MKVGAILHHIGRENPQRFLEKLAFALKQGLDVVIGSDYTLDFELTRPNTTSEKENIYKEIENLSRVSSTLVLPGTISYPLSDTEMVHVAPVFCEGSLLAELRKKRDNGEGDLAKLAGLNFVRGNGHRKLIEHAGKKFAVEICGDHGSQNVRGCDIELILAYDKNAGFHLNSINSNFSRKVVVCDGYEPFASAFDYNHLRREERLRIVSGKVVDRKLKIFEI